MEEGRETEFRRVFEEGHTKRSGREGDKENRLTEAIVIKDLDKSRGSSCFPPAGA